MKGFFSKLKKFTRYAPEKIFYPLHVLAGDEIVSDGVTVVFHERMTFETQDELLKYCSAKIIADISGTEI